MASKEITLSTGIKITDSRHLGCGVFIENQKTKYLQLGYSIFNGIYIHTLETLISQEDFFRYRIEFSIIEQSFNESIEFLDPKAPPINDLINKK